MATQERAWAVGLSQQDFEREFVKRTPWADVIPDVVQWAEWEEPENRLIDAPDPEDINKPDGENPKSKHAPLKVHLGFPCRGCGRVFDFKIARAGHERGCKTAISKKMEVKVDAE
jgi:hypothetical protein